MGCDIHGIIRKKSTDEMLGNFSTTTINDVRLGQRNYLLFAMLAGVRNYGNWKPIAADRGVVKSQHLGFNPYHDEADGDDEEGCFEHDCVDAHSQTHCTLAEAIEHIEGYGATTGIRRSIWMKDEDYQLWDFISPPKEFDCTKDRPPEDWTVEFSAEFHCSNSTLDKAMKILRIRTITISIPVAEALGPWCAAAKDLAGDIPHEDVELIMWFDS